MIQTLAIPLALTCCLLSSASADEISRQDQARLALLEQTLFERKLDDAQLTAKLVGLSEDTTDADLAALVLQTHGCQDAITAFADECEDIEVRELCARLVAELDDGWRETPAGKEYVKLAAKNADALLPEAWAAFQKSVWDQSACSKLLAVKPEVVWQFIPTIVSKKRAGWQNVINTYRSMYLMLRIRDLSPDEFAAERISDTPSWDRSKRRVFPKSGSARFVGHVELKHLTTNRLFGAKPTTTVELYPIRYAVFGYRSNPTHVSVRSISYSKLVYGPYSSKQFGKFDPFTAEQRAKQNVKSVKGFIHQSSYLRSPCVPELDLSDAQSRRLRTRSDRVAWWWTDYVSALNASRLPLLPRDAKSYAPAEITANPIVGLGPKALAGVSPEPPADAPSFVILPPRFTGRATEPQTIAGELASDRIAQEFAETGRAQIVDRKHLKQLLDERVLNVNLNQPMVSYDAMIRLEVQNQRRGGNAVLSAIDLSTGSILQSREFPWPIPESSAPDVVVFVKKSVDAVSATDKRLKVRFLGTEQPASLRLAPLAEELTNEFARRIRESRGFRSVEHIESASAAEESLMLLMGLSRVPGGRRFAPQSDVSIALQLREGDSLGKRVAETPLSSRVIVLVPGQDAVPDVVTGTVSEFRKVMLPELWKRTRKYLDAVDPNAAPTLSLMETRKRQAAEELEAISTIDPRSSSQDKATQHLFHAQTALKLDPTSLPAEFELVIAQEKYVRAFRDAPDSKALALDGLRRVARKIDKLKEDPIARDRWLNACTGFSFALGAHRLKYVKTDEEKAVASEVAKLMAQVGEFGFKTATAKPRLNADRFGGTFVAMSTLLERGVEGLSALGANEEELRQRLLPVLRDTERLETEFAKRQQDHKSEKIAEWREMLDAGEVHQQASIGRNLVTIRKKLMLLTCLLGMADEADELQLRLRGDLARSPNIVSTIRRALKVLDDEQRTQAFERWYKRWEEAPAVSLVETQWPRVNAFAYAGTKPAPVGVKQVPFTLENEDAVFPVARTKSRLFFLTGKVPFVGWKLLKGRATTRRPAQRFGYFPMDRNGRPGKPVFVKLPDSSLSLTSVVANEDRVLLGCSDTQDGQPALCLLDTKTNEWRVFRLEDGLPCRLVRSMHLLSNDRVLCVGMAQHGVNGLFTFSLRNGEVRSYASGRTENGFYVPSRLFDAYERDGKVYGFSQFGWCKNLLGASPVLDRITPLPSYMRDVRNSLHVGDRVFFVRYPGLQELAPSGDVRRVWSSAHFQSWSRDTRDKLRVTVPADSPMMTSWDSCVCGDMVVFFGPKGVLAFDPDSDTWYGPVRTPESVYALPDGNGFWLGGKSVQRVELKAVVRAAKKCDRAMTTAQFVERRDAAIKKLVGLARVKAELSLRRYPAAIEAMDAATAVAPPESANVHYVTGLLFDTWGANEPEKALAAYARAAKFGEPNMALTAHYRRCLLLKNMNRDDEAREAAKKMLEEFPRVKADEIRFAIRNLASE